MASRGRGSSYPAEIRAGVVAALKMGDGVREAARRYKVPQSTVHRWKLELEDELRVHDESQSPALASEGETPGWLPVRKPTMGAEVEALAGEMIHGTRVLTAYLVHPDHLARASFSDVVAALDSMAERVARVAAVVTAMNPAEPGAQRG